MPYITITVPAGTSIGQTVDATIGIRPAQVTLHSEKTLRVEPDDVCTIITADTGKDGSTTFCAIGRPEVLSRPSCDPEASKKGGELIRPATDRAQGNFAPAFFTDEALQRLEEGLRGALSPFPSPPAAPAQYLEDAMLPAQSPSSPVASQGLPVKHAEQETSPPIQEGRSEPNAASLPPGAQALGKAEKTADWLNVSTEIEATRENPHLASGADQSDVRLDEFTQALNRVDDCVAELIRSCSEQRRGLGSFAESTDSRVSHCHQKHSILPPSRARCQVRRLRQPPCGSANGFSFRTGRHHSTV